MEKNGKNYTKISGYLEKKGKKKMISSYKKYWFVLEGGLLLYYRSKDDYESISPCKGSINLGPPCIIKPCPSLVGVFQVQTRIATVTLRAENLEDQNRWMQAIMAEIQPSKNIHRMSHFRYSMENLPQPKELVRNSTPESESSQNSHEDIIHRLQKMGAQSYGNPIDSISKVVTLRKDRIGIPNFNSDDTNLEHRLSNNDSKSSEHIYEKISTEYLDGLNRERDGTKNKETDEIEKKSQVFNTLRIKSEENRPKTFIIENDTYAISIQQKEKVNATEKEEKKECVKTKRSLFASKPKNISKSVDTGQEKSKKKKLRHSKSLFVNKKKAKNDSVTVENDTYASVEKRNSLSANKHVPESNPRDLNENDVVRDEILKIEEENAYSIPYTNDKNDILYEDIDKDNVEYAEPCIYPIEETDKKKSKLKNQQHEEKSKENVDNDKPKAKIKKRSSFIKRVWKKKDKNKNKNEDKIEDNKVDEEEVLYETVPASVVEKVCVTDSAAVQMLSELQNILEHKMPILIERISNDMTSPTQKTQPEHVPEAIKETVENIIQNNVENVPDHILPLAPSKIQKQDIPSPFHDVPINNKPVVLPPKMKKLENIKSLDEILDELDSQEPITNKNKVQKLIKKFSEPDFFENDVVLRNSCKTEVQRDEIDSDELSWLLGELAKVTMAPILLPGVTSSLNGANIKHEELSKLLPSVKQRRFSEPDYDIPRPHKSLTIAPKKDDVSANVIGSTRFFGPILKPSGMIVPNEVDISETTPSQLHSITPDSLEANISQIPPTVPTEENIETEEPVYSTHKYYTFMDRNVFNNLVSSNSEDTNVFHNSNNGNINNNYSDISEKSSDDYMVDNEIYAQPRSIQNFQLETDKPADYEHDDEVFVDSLEVCKNEVSTEF